MGDLGAEIDARRIGWSFSFPFLEILVVREGERAWKGERFRQNPGLFAPFSSRLGCFEFEMNRVWAPPDKAAIRKAWAHFFSFS